ncbi:MAG: hypothetical protein AABW80_01780 [Nanoarchaeota archaeon]
MKENKYPEIVATRVPKEVLEALKNLAKDRKKDFPRYSEADAVRSAIVNHLKSKGFLDKGKNYL